MKKNYSIWDDSSFSELSDAEEANLWYNDEKDNLDKEIDGVIIGFAKCYSRYGAICHNGACGTRIYGRNLNSILDYCHADYLRVYGKNRNVYAELTDHDKTNSVIFRIAKDYETAEDLQNKVCNGMTIEEFKQRTKSIYPLIKNIYGW
jgi:hypothetical protein